MMKMMAKIQQGLIYDGYKAYENNEKIEVDYHIGRNRILVVSEEAQTRYANATRAEYIEQGDFLALIKTVRKQARRSGKQLKGINNLTAYINDNYDRYNRTFRVYDKKFDVLAVMWQQHEGKIRNGTTYDAVYNEVLKPMEFELQRFWYNDCILMKFLRLYDMLKTFSKSLEADEVEVESVRLF